MPETPQFASEQEEADFWDAHSAMEFFDQTTPVDLTFVDKRPRKVAISLRLEPDTVAQLKRVARARGIGYQTLIRMWVLERLAEVNRT